ncbi:alpha-hydroxy acid oxidase [Pseudohalocynthiibacter aestuariivivens]|jgi:isopentenyl diphosphate isomerase/L-lactate dehydrogenase-like FMN-dependent dehydrogenase|uniref:Alpha-hydroxy acid oxidase n=1 Tax=Pseudohalocynthiibacter aestuariivivens TaxID=1591409 RepID=A0ABV5JE75_9RHOB|nr:MULTISPECIES: alpha-hydroxy acid oxidase [Pseudohalocynthiibacter]MBS9717085.1 alpha-hydroxy-acid oxidizing protein [Pseudohalocynthiibacter aestuariivivens]MCK0103991.1 alpha-hydroxy-acid oxidizing protein [Pseudohalocynthiibacter sp. F2068]
MFASNEIHSSSDARRLARKRLPWMVFDYIDGAAGEEYGEALNRQVLRDLRLQPRILNNVEKRDLSVPVFGHDAKRPFGISPMGMCNLSTPGADLMLARLAATHHVPFGVSTVASTPMEQMIEVAEGHAWFQLYFSGDGSGTQTLVDRARAAGFKTLVLTLDVPEVGRRPRELRRGFKMPFRLGPQQFVDFALHPTWSLSTLLKGRPELANFGGEHATFDRTESRARADWGYLAKLRDQWKGNLVVKGVLNVEDAVQLKKIGINAVQVSSHGGRQLDSAPPAILALRKIREAVGEGFPLFYDSGLRSGEDVVKAYAMGADFVFFGRPLLFAMATRREKGLNQLWDVLSQETSLTLAQLGLTTMPSLEPNQLPREHCLADT